MERPMDEHIIRPYGRSKIRPDIDRGWAWVVMAAVYMGMMIYCITLYMNGVLYLALLDKYGGTDVKASLVGAFAGGLLCFLGPVAGILNNLFSCRFSIVLGGVFTSVGFASSAFVPSLDWVIFTAGVLVGVVLILGSLSGFGAMCCRTDGHNKPAVYSIDVEGEKLEEEELTVVDNHVTPDRSSLSASGTRIYGHDETCEQGQPLLGEKNEIKSHFS
ncbi:MOT10-like protein [Mya arenaria]|uniref:MOT10-like protein n=1 Tax=Mya arenaria TaxID=6604 RepID=A0ABY7G420_MYAAR|nr:MOT10-like protein [Mya arenaria]